METTTQTPEVDPEIEALRGKVPGIESVLPEKPEDKKPVEPTKPTEPPATKKPDASTEKKEDDEPKGDESEEDDEEEDKGDDPAPTRKSRPLKYIPVDKYTSEKKNWNETIAQRDARIKELEAIKNGEENSKKNEAAIKAYAEKHGSDEDSVRDLIDLMRGDDAKKPDAPTAKPADKPELTAEQQERVAKADQIVAEQMFNDEFVNVATPEIKNLFPNATPEQIAEAKTELEKLACTEAYLDKPLDFIVYKERQKGLAKVFVQTRKGPDGGNRSGANKNAPVLSASDFVDEKTPFDELDNLPEMDRNKIIEDMDIKTYDKYMNHAGKQSTGLVIDKKGKKRLL